MIKLIEEPRREDFKIEYTIEGDVLNVKWGDDEEAYDFTGLPEGELEKAETEVFEICPIFGGIKQGNILTLRVYRPYSFEEKELFEGVKNPLEV